MTEMQLCLSDQVVFDPTGWCYLEIREFCLESNSGSPLSSAEIVEAYIRSDWFQDPFLMNEPGEYPPSGVHGPYLAARIEATDYRPAEPTTVVAGLWRWMESEGLSVAGMGAKRHALDKALDVGIQAVLQRFMAAFEVLELRAPNSYKHDVSFLNEESFREFLCLSKEGRLAVIVTSER